MAKVIAILALPGVQLLDVAGPLDVFSQANLESGATPYQCRIIGTTPGPIRSSSGARLYADASVRDATERFDTVLVAGAPQAASAELNPATMDWMRSAAGSARRYGSVCTGAFILAHSGLLQGRRVTTHWACAEALAEAYPDLKVEEDAIYIRDGKVRTSAGVTAGLDLALALVEEDLGRDIARRVASQLVMYFKRPGGQLQFSRHGESSLEGRTVLQETQRWVMANLALPHSVKTLAAHAGKSPRHFARLFSAEVGVTPAAWLERARIGAARLLLEEDGQAPKQVAARVGFTSVDTLRRAFVKHVGITPAEYRKRFHI
ncbi:GlxA family transcriptional regulator [Salinicola halimionae]|uniref:GlxA family transcriptional regulator n=1 Tax=Salinicola halimionae TaxID=1949081 RepID=UPI000DA16C81|nr:GlxA family transcriptional regulator [Salinicola halimionae]